MVSRFSTSLLVATALGAGCSDTATTCLTDTDCDQGQVCEKETCAASCTTAADCGPTEMCVARSDNDGRTCSIAGTTTDDPEVTQESWIALIRDTSSSSCDAEDPGSDIVAVHLEDLAGQPVAFASFVLGGVQGDANMYTDTSHFDGRNTLDVCGATPATSLGCDGWLALRFEDSAGKTVILDPVTTQLHVYERGEACGPDELDEPYQVFVCAAPDAVENNDDITSCTLLVGDGNGEAVLPLDSVATM